MTSRPRRTSAIAAKVALALLGDTTNNKNEEESEEYHTLDAPKKRRGATDARTLSAAKRRATTTPQAPLVSVKIANASPLVFLALKRVIDQFNNGTDSIVNVEGFTSECKRIAASPDLLNEAIRNASLSLSFTSGKHEANQKIMFFGTGQYDGRHSYSANERVGLRTRLAKLADCPQCKCISDDTYTCIY
jgi:hypothetical protein